MKKRFPITLAQGLFAFFSILTVLIAATIPSGGFRADDPAAMTRFLHARQRFGLSDRIVLLHTEDWDGRQFVVFRRENRPDVRYLLCYEVRSGRAQEPRIFTLRPSGFDPSIYSSALYLRLTSSSPEGFVVWSESEALARISTGNGEPDILVDTAPALFLLHTVSLTCYDGDGGMLL